MFRKITFSSGWFDLNRNSVKTMVEIVIQPRTY